MQDQDEFSITTAHQDGCVVLSVRGDLDELTADTLDDALTSLDSALVIVDLTETSFVCSASIHVLTKHRPQGRPALVVPAGHIARVLRIVDADRTNEIFVDRHTALQSLGLSQLAQAGPRR